jgi:dimethylhistidine N-methyltransferase
MTTIALPVTSKHIVEERVASAVRKGLGAKRKLLPPWLFYDEAGSRLFDEITERPEYYLTRTERGIFAAHAEAMLALAAGPDGKGSHGNEPVRLRIAELGAGSADKTRLLLAAAVGRQGTVVYEPVDVSASALEAAAERIEREIDGVTVAPRVMDYTHEFEAAFAPKLDVDLELEAAETRERLLVLFIGSSIGNFEPWEAAELLRMVRMGLTAGDLLLLGVDRVKDEATLLSAYNDFAGVTAAFNLNLLARLNRELGADFDLEAFEHRAVWNGAKSRIEMHLESRIAQTVRLNGMDIDGLDFEVQFAEGESIHTENSYKYRPGQVEEMMAAAGFAPLESWTDEQGWFGVCLGRAE